MTQLISTEPVDPALIPTISDPTLFKTKVPIAELKPETLIYLKGWRPPRGAYVLFEKRQVHLLANATYRLGTGLMTLNLEARPEQESKLNYYVFKKKFRIIDYGNFPKLNDPDPIRAQKARMYSGANGANPWDAMEQTILGLMNANPNWKEERAKYDSTVAGLKAKLADMEAKLGGQNSGERYYDGKNTRSK